MQKKLEDKLFQVLKIIETKVEENMNYFKNISIEFYKVDKVHKAELYINANDELIFELNKTKKIISKCEIALHIIENTKPYDNCSIKYIERGSNMVIWTEKGNVKVKNTEANITEQNMAHSDVGARSNRNYVIKVGEADDLLKEIGIINSEGKVRNDMIRKYNQIDHFVELIDPLLKELLDKESINILDCACGKSYLSFVLNYYIKEKLKKQCSFVCIDISENVIQSSKKMAQNLGYRNMEFVQMDIQNYQPNKKIDLIISLHGCDVATDMAMAAGVRFDAKAIIVVPCCHSEILNQYDFPLLKEIIKHGVLKTRMADVLTEGIRILLLESMGYEVSIVEYISPLDTPKNLLIRAIKKSGKNKKFYEEYIKLKDVLGINPTLARLLNI